MKARLLPLLILAAALLLVLVGSPRLQAQNEFTSIEARQNSGVTIKVTGFYSNLPLTGYAPIRIHVVNRTKIPRNYTFYSGSYSGHRSGTRMTYEARMSVAAGEQRVFEVMAPLSTMNDEDHVYANLDLSFSGLDVANSSGAQSSHHQVSGVKPVVAPYVALSKRIATNHQGQVTSILKDTHDIIFVGGTFDPGMAPGDWRGYAGIDALYIMGDELESMAPGAVAAVLDYVAQGGRLYLLLPQGTGIPMGLLGEPEYNQGGKLRKGLGEINIVRVTEGAAMHATLAGIMATDFERATTAAGPPTLSKMIRTGYDNSWLLQKVVRTLSLNAPVILFFMLAFAVLVGPINLFVFAKSKYRYRLFWTTPIISLATSLLLFIVILLQDGTGGTGARTSTVFLLPGENKVVQIQEQLSRTGLLFGQTFKLPESVFPAQLVPHNDDSAYTAATDFDGPQIRLSNFSGEMSGEWFRSRERQAQLLTAVSPSRARVEILPPTTPGSPPSVRSNLGVMMQKLHFRGAGPNPDYWMAERIGPGDTVKLIPTTRVEMEQFQGDTIRGTGRRTVTAFDQRLYGGEAYFVAEAAESTDEFMLPTLPTVNWKTDRVFFVSFLGSESQLSPVTGAGAPPPAAPEPTPETAPDGESETVIEVGPTATP